MKKITKIMALLLAAVMMLCVFAGCESEGDKIAVLAGTWELNAEYPAEDTTELLESLGFIEEEIALIDLDSLSFVQTVTYTTDKQYSYGYDVDASRELADEFWTNAMAAIYEGRTSLNEAYEVEFDDWSEADFYQLYAELFSLDSADAMMDMLVESTYAYDVMAEPFETGTYTINGNLIMCTITGESQAESLEYAIDGNQLTLTYSDAVEVYTRA